MWPYLAFGGSFLFVDSATYLAQGDAILNWLAKTLERAVAADGSAETRPGPVGSDVGVLGSLTEAANEADEVRSLPYALFTAMTRSSVVGDLGAALLQAFASFFMLWPLVAACCTRVAQAGVTLAALAAISPLPFFATYMMPDVFGGAVILYYIILLGPIWEIGAWPRAALAAVATFAISTHYGNIPLAAGLAAMVLALIAARRALTPASVVFAVGPIAAVLLLNLVIGLVLTSGNSASATPLRLPLVLARSIEDGPARWYLEAACPQGGYAICGVFPDEIPDNIQSVMWREGGLSTLDRAVLDRVRSEELTVLWRSFLQYPVEQAWSLTGNAVLQSIQIGTAGLRPTGNRADLFDLTLWRGLRLRSIIDSVLFAGYLAGCILLVVTLHPRNWSQRREVEMAFAVLVGLAGNALIFGGLSAPVDRYQTRLAWVAVAVAVLVAPKVCRGRQKRAVTRATGPSTRSAER